MSEANYIHDVIIGSGEGVVFRDPGAVRMLTFFGYTIQIMQIKIQ